MSAEGTLISLLTIVGIYAILSLALNMKFGFTGILDFGHVAFYAVGAYAAALVIMVPPEETALQDYLFGLNLQARIIDLTGIELLGGFGWVVAIGFGILVAGFLGLLVALPAIRLREDYLAITLLGVSVIVVNVIQTEGWLANGPDNLRGYSRPFSGLLPLPGESVDAAILLGITIFLAWLLLLYIAARGPLGDNPHVKRGKLANRALALTTMGIGYIAVNRTRERISQRSSDATILEVTPSDYLDIFGAAGVIGLASIILSLVGMGSMAILVFLGLASLTMWVVVLIKIREYYHDYDRRSVSIALGLAIALYLSFTPVSVLGEMEGIIGNASVLVTFALLGGFGYGLYRLYNDWDGYGIAPNFLGLVGLMILWLVAIRYFLISLRGSGSVASIVNSTRDNIFWLVDFGVGLDVGLNYSRFFMVIVLGIVLLSYLLWEMIATSPYGRVLKAIRDDENVALSLGKNTFYFKVQGMVLGSALAGLAGALAAVYYRSLGYTLFHPIVTFYIFLAVVLGGRGNNKGVILGAALYWLLVRATTELTDVFPGWIGGRFTILRNALIGIMLILVLYYRPDGLWKEERTILEVPDR